MCAQLAAVQRALARYCRHTPHTRPCLCARVPPCSANFSLLLLLSITRPGKQHNVHTPAPGLLRLRRSQAKEHTTKWLCNKVQRRGNLTRMSLSLAHAKHTRFGS
jgi:hypothetical protein